MAHAKRRAWPPHVVSVATCASTMVLLIGQTTGSFRRWHPCPRKGRSVRLVLRRSSESLPFEGAYNGAAIDHFFGTRPVQALARLGEIISRINSARAAWSDDTKPDADRGEFLRLEVAALGPVFVKVAQTLATRSDIVDQRLAKELGLLQDAMATFDDGIAMATIREEFDWHGPIVAISEMHSAASSSLVRHSGEALFAELSPSPVAAASLAQVYRGELTDGTRVAVKVQRPGLLEQVGLDFFVLRLLLAAVNALFGISRSTKAVQGVLDEVGDGLFAELDFTQEAEHIDRFTELYGARCPDVVVPRVVWSRTRPRVLTMTWLQGRKPRELNPAEKLRLVRAAGPCLALQLMDAGFLHCDPHEGNMMLLDDGRLGLLDFGLVAQMTPVHQESMASAILNLLAGDYKALVPCFVGMGVLNAEAGDLRRPGVEKPFADALEEALSDGDSRKMRVQCGGLDRRRAFGQLYEELSDLAFRYYFTLPSYYVLVMRSFVTLEGIAFAADPSFNMYESAYPFALQRMLRPRTALGRRLLRDAFLTEPEGRLKLLWLLEERGGRTGRGAGRSTAATAATAATGLRAALAALLVPEGRALRRVLREADSVGLIADLRAPVAKPLRRALAGELARGLRRSLVAGEPAQPTAAQAAGRRRRRCRHLAARLVLAHLSAAARRRPRALAALLAQLAAALVRQLVMPAHAEHS